MRQSQYQAVVLLPAEVLVDPRLPFGDQLGGFVAPVPIGRMPGMFSTSTVAEQPADSVR